MMNEKQPVGQTKVLKDHDDEVTEYAILSHRWNEPTEVNYESMVDLEKMDVKERNDIRQRLGYKKILDTCEQAKKDEYDWVWVDTCCIDKRSSAELSEAINSMYRWYANSAVCYAYLHDVGSFFPAKWDDKQYPKSDGWPEWFSRGWTLQEMIAPSNVQFFNKTWTGIGDKKTLAPTLTRITRVPEHILKEGLFGNRPCVAQIMSWAANRRTTRVEDEAYSLMGLLDVNMPMLYGEGKKAFHRLQLEIIRTSNDQSIFAWAHNTAGVRTGSILADNPDSFWHCSEMELLDHDEFIRFVRKDVRKVKLPAIDEDHFGVFPITNRGIQIWMLLRPYSGSDSVFRAYLPCRGESGYLVTINLALWKSNYYRYSRVYASPSDSLQFRQVYLRYEDMPCNVTFEIDDSAITENGFTRFDAHPSELPGNTLTPTNPLCIKNYLETRGNRRFSAAFGQCFGQDWVHLVNNPHDDFSGSDTGELVVKGPDRSQSMADVPSRGDFRGRLWVRHTRLLGSPWIVRTCRVVWERLRIGVRIEMFQDPRLRNGLDEWKKLDIEVSDFLVRHMDYTMIIHRKPMILLGT